MSIIAFPKHQSGISIIMAIVALLGLSLLGTMVAVLTSTQSESTANERFSAQALYAAESGTQVAAYLINHNAGDCTQGTVGTVAAPVALEANLPAWYYVTSTVVTIDTINVCQIVSTGLAGGTDVAPIASREITADYKSVVVP
jgi:Tfp pilus assembly protein PilX